MGYTRVRHLCLDPSFQIEEGKTTAEWERQRRRENVRERDADESRMEGI